MNVTLLPLKPNVYHEKDSGRTHRKREASFVLTLNFLVEEFIYQRNTDEGSELTQVHIEKLSILQGYLKHLGKIYAFKKCFKNIMSRKRSIHVGV